ncbi:MAG TPA: phage tail protein [Phnomibacter sp.]|nr:phage tail protein [Phnomibacter sp.]
MSQTPLVGFHFNVQFHLDAGLVNIGFQDVSGIGVELETESVTEGGENRFTYKLPVRSSYSNLVLKRAVITDAALVAWCKAAIEDLDVVPAGVVVSLLNENHEPLRNYAFINAYPLKWNISNLNAESSNLVIETLELYYQFYRTI